MDDATLKRMGEMAYTLYESDPEVKAKLDEAAEKTYPGIHARVSAQKVVAAGTADIEKAKAEFRAEVATEKAQRERERRVNEILSNRELGLRAEDVPEIEKHMLARGIGNYEDGAYSWRRANHVAPPVASRASTWEVPGVGEDGIQGGLSWMKGIVRPGFGVDLDLLDRRTRQQRDTILDDYERDPVTAESKWGQPSVKPRWMN